MVANDTCVQSRSETMCGTPSPWHRSRPWFAWMLSICLLPALLPDLVHGEADEELTGPSANDRHVTFQVSRLMNREHLSRRPIDDQISERALKMYLKSLDPMKLYFLQSDVDEFARYKDSIDDYVKSGDTLVAYTIFRRFLQRVDERTAEIDGLVNAEHDFTLNERLITDPDMIEYAANNAELTDRWRKRIKYELLFRIAGDDEDDEDADETPKTREEKAAEAREKAARRYKSIAKRKHQIDSDELLELFLTSVTSSYDPHTSYMSPASHTNFEINMRLNLDGIGAALMPEDGYTVVTKIIPGGAADKAGDLEIEDKIVSVGQGEDGEMEDVVDMKLSDVVQRIRGRAGTVVRLGLVRGTKEKEIKITRARIELKDSEARGEVTEFGKGPDGQPLKIGVIDLPSFYMDMEGARMRRPDYKSTTRDVRRILKDFKAQGVDVVALDLTRNGGGSLTEAINLTGLFLDVGPVVQVKDANGVVQHYDDVEPGMAWDGPLVILTSRFSASASEILAGAIQDYRRGIIVGDESTHGKGTVQSLMELGSELFHVPNPPNLGALKITMQQFYRPHGDSTQKRGVRSDIQLPSITNEIDGISESDLDYAIDFDRVPPAPFEQLTWVSKDLIASLTAQSKARREQSEDYQKLARVLQRYREQKDRKYVTLNEADFRKEREEFDAEREEEKTFKQQMDQDEIPVIPDTFSFKEILNICADYANATRGMRVVQANR